MRRGLLIGLLCLFALATGSARADRSAPESGSVEVVVGLSQKPLGTTRWLAGRQLQARTLSRAQARVAETIRTAVPESQVRWRYRLVANGMAVVVPRSELGRLASLPGVARVYPSVRYKPLLDRGPAQIGAPSLWGPGLENAGQGMKIAIIDEGVDQTHPFFSPAGYTMPAGYPKGQAAYTTAKVIVARAFPPARPTWRHASKPFDPEHSSHGTHVAGIAAGDPNTMAEGVRISGVAPRAYLGNYKALTIPTDADVGLDGNSPELVAAIEAAVADGMDVINMSLGEPEIEPARDIVAQALSAAAKAGVVPVVAAGNDFADFGRGSVSSPGSAADAITVGAVTTSRSGADDVAASFSSSGPTPLSLRLKPEVNAPGVAILSSVPGGYLASSGTSMAAPHVAGAAALLLQRHPTWTPAQVKSALTQTGDAAYADDKKTVELSTVRAGGGVIDLPRADVPLLFAAPATLSFGLVGPSATVTRQVDLTDAGGGAGDPWTVTIEQQSISAATRITAPPTVAVPGQLTVTVTTTRAADAELTGYVVLTRGADVRRIPYWLRTGAPKLATEKHTPLRRAGLHSATTNGGASRVARYLYPEKPSGFGFASELPGPERVFRVTLPRPAQNFGVVITRLGRGVGVEPRIVLGGDERRLTGFAALPYNLNPYLRGFGDPVLAAGVILPAAGAYDVVFDSRSAARAGAFSFRYWLNDTMPPAAVLRTPQVRGGAPLVVAVSDRGSGVDGASLVVHIDGNERSARFAGGRIQIPTTGLGSGRHELRLQISDYQETRNMENVGIILPNTRILTATFSVGR